MKTKFKSKCLSILLVLVMVLALVPVSALTVFAAGENVDFAIKESWGVYFEQTGLNRKYPIVLTNENKLSTPLPTLYRTDSDDYVFDGWYIADTDTKVTQDTVFDGYTVVVDRWTFQEKDNNTVISNIRVNNVELVAGMTTAEYNAAVQGATATVNGAPASAITADSAKTYTIYHGLNKSGDPLEADEEVEVGQDYSVVTKIKLANGYTFDPNITFLSDAGMCASERFLGGADIYTKEWNTLATEIEMTINFMNTDYYFAQTPESRNLENYTQYKNWYTVSKADGLESVTLQYESDGVWAVFIGSVPFEAVGAEAGGYVTVSPYVDTTKTFRLVANYTQGKVYSEPFEISWACLTPVIESVGIGITAPQSGYSPEYTATIGTSRCALKSENASTVKNGIKWTGESGELTVVGSSFTDESDYIVSIKLVAQDGYTFANDVTATINANNANVNVISETEIRVSYTFPKPEKPKWFVNFNNIGGYASGTMQPVQIEEGSYTLPEPTYTPNTGYVFEGWLVKGLLKQPGDVITVTENTYLEAKWKDTNDYDAPHGFTKQPSDASNIVGMQIQYAVDNFTIDPSITYEHVFAEIYNAETGEWVTTIDGVSAGNGIIENYGQQMIVFNSSIAGEFTFRLRATKSGTTVAISESFTVTWSAKKFTTQPQGDMVVVGDTVTVTADKNFYVEKYEIEYNDGGVWKLYQEVSGGWNAFSFGFTSDVAKSVTFRLKAYADVYDEEQDGWVVGLIDTSEEFTITWTSNEHVHAYGAIPNGKDETNHWKECTDPACPDKAHSKIEVEAHKDNTADYKCDVCGYDLPIPTYQVIYQPGEASGNNEPYEYEANDTITFLDCEDVGYTRDGFEFDYWSIRILGDNLTEVAQKRPNETYTLTTDIIAVATWKAIQHECVGVAENGQGATCTVDGWKDYYRCECSKYYEDADCQIPINDLEAWKVGAGKITAAHSGTPEWTKTATTHAKKYTCCDTFVVETEAHEWNNGTCSECGYVCLHTADTNKDHKCDACGSTVGTHEAALGKHTCDYCEKTVTECADSNKDHKCDTCGEAMGTHVAASGKHTCDYCGKTASECADANDDGKCDICGANYGACVDSNKDHLCDKHGETMGTHEAALGKHTCDYCNKPVTECSDDNKDHKCDTCGEAMGTHVAASGKHTCDYCNKVVTECADGNKDHKCDTCSTAMGTHEAATGKHTCDYCGKTVTECADSDKNHKCDTCSSNMGTHEAASGKHTCDYCTEVVTQCVDSNKDHKCDICGAAMGTHEAASGKHTCDYCGKTVTECADTNSDGKCDTCGANYGECVDTNKDHKCDKHGEAMGTHEAALGKHTCDYCGQIVTECEDANKDHKCDTCETAIGTHQAATGKHTCDYCGKTVTECADSNKDHKCDTCSTAMGTHEAADGKHTCDYCGKTVTDCTDSNKDHKCDTCSTAMGTHEAANGKHTCDYCGVAITECVDTNKDHKCDTCGASVGVHNAATGKHTCDYCGKTVTECTDSSEDDDSKCDICGKNIGDCVDANKDHKCDKHDENMGMHEAALGKHTCDYCGKTVTECADANKDHKCDTCSANVGTHKAATGKHTCDYCGKTVTECADSNKDHKCDTCSTAMGTHEAANGKHSCDYCGKDVTECSDGNTDGKCDVCQKDLGTVHMHDYGTTWKTDANNHWKECACGEKSELAAHVDNNGDNKCDTCDYTMPVHNPDTPDNPDNPNNTPDNPDNTPDDPSDDKDGLGAGAIVGIVIGSVAVAGVGGFALLWFVIKKKTWAEFLAIFKKK